MNMINSGHDPEGNLPSNKTPPQIAQEIGDQELINFVQDAIDKKHKKESL